MNDILAAALEFDRKHIWHPYTSATKPLPTHLVESAQGTRIQLASGETLIDGMASWWCAIHGYNHPKLNRAVEQQLGKMSHVMFGGLTHQPAIELCKKLVEMTPQNLRHVFLADSGSISVEVAMKMAIQYWQAKSNGAGNYNKSKMLTLRGGYHGDTFAAMSVCDPETGMHHLFNDSVHKQIFTQRPSCRFDSEFSHDSVADFEAIIGWHAHELAAVILEPVVQGAGGMWFYHPKFLQAVRKLCDHHDVLLIADEIATGFGRTGQLFACDWAEVEPDILCLGKALTGGYMTLAATLTTEKVAHGISANGGVFMHGPTFMGNPLACAVAVASLELLQEMNWQFEVARISETLEIELSKAREFDSVADVRVLGAIGVIEMHQSIDVSDAQAFFVARGVWIRPFGKTLYTMPPYITNNSELRQLCEAMVAYVRLSAG